jgi:hypothetical protein
MRVVSARGLLDLVLGIASAFVTHVHAARTDSRSPVCCPDPGHLTGRAFAAGRATAGLLEERRTRPACR